MVFRAGTHNLLVRGANREDPDHTAVLKQSDLGLRCLSKPFWQATSVENFRTFTVYRKNKWSKLLCVMPNLGVQVSSTRVVNLGTTTKVC